MGRGGSKKKRGGNRNPATDLLLDHNPAADLPDDILSRLPFKSVCRFKCVSQHWRDGLNAIAANRTKLPQTLTGFFRCIETSSSTDGDRDSNDETSAPDFVSIVGKDEHQVISPSLSFLPRASYRSIEPKHCSNGLLVCICWKVFPRNEADYVVCNPATEQWVTVPGCGHSNMSASAMQLHLAVDPASSSGHFHLFAILEEADDQGFIYGVDIYSSETGVWIHKENGWDYEDRLHPVAHSVFRCGTLYLVTQISVIIYVDTEGTRWGSIQVMEDYMEESNDPSTDVTFIGESQGRVHYVSTQGSDDCSELSVWILDDDDEWMVKYKISTASLFGDKLKDIPNNWYLVAIHPEWNTLFFTARSDNVLLLSYHMDSREVRVLGSFDGRSCNPYLPYVPSFRVIAS